MPDYKKEWLEKARIDYFSQFISLWLGFNSWYRSHYSEIDKTDRAFIDKIKSDYTGRNQLFTHFSNLLNDAKIKENIKFKSDLESLHYCLNRANVKYPKGYHSCHINFTTALFDNSRRNDFTAYLDLTRKPRQPNKIKLDEIFLTSDKEEVFSCLIEIMYQFRCYLIHGNLEPTEENHEVIKYCYFVLSALLK